MADCFLCEDFVGEVQGDGGVKGRRIGNRDICEQCLAELKHCMDGIKAKSPDDREIKDDESDGLEEQIEENDERNEENYDPSSSSVKI